MAYSKEFLLSRVSITDCWEWQGYVGTHGYGVLPDHTLAHRAFYEFFVGPIKQPLIICHKCDNRLCCNPEHLIPGTHSDNTRDAFAKGRMHNPALKLTDGDVEAIRELLDKGVRQYEIAERFGVRPSMISRIKSGLRRATPNTKHQPLQEQK